ncbi:MAG: ABC transporter permease subunit [Pseudomonadota bacterium]
MFESLQQLWIGPDGRGLSLLMGLASTVQIALGAYALGLTIGLFGALGKIHGGPILRWTLEIYTTLIRAVPELVLILLLYYAGTAALNNALVSLGMRPVDISGLVAGIVVLGVVQGAYSTEVIRAAMQAVPRGQTEAALAYGMSRAQSIRRILIPAMIPFAIPGLANLWLIVTKDTALLAVVGFFELATATKAAAGSTRDYLTFYLAAAVLYLCLTLVSNRIFVFLERRYRRGQAGANAAGTGI